MSSQFVNIPDRFRAGLAALLTAYDYAQDSQTDAWQFAVDLHDLLSTGATLADVRWLVIRGFAEHARETTIPGDKFRTFRVLPPTHLPPDLCVTLSETGAAALRRLVTSGFEISPRSPFEAGEITGESPQGEATGIRCSATTTGQSAPVTRQSTRVPAHKSELHPARDESAPGCAAVAPTRLAKTRAAKPLKPVWDPALRELRYNGLVVKRYRVPAGNQAAILDAFQEDGWPKFIDDPIPPEHGIDPKDRLKVTIKSLNRNQVHRLIQFHGNGNGLQVYWEAVEPA